MLTDAERAALADSIREAFRDTPYPGDDNIGDGHFEAERLAERLKGKHWSELSVDDVYIARDDIYFLTLQAFRFYLPAFLLAMLYHYNELDIVAVSLIHNICPPNAPVFEPDNEWMDRMGRNNVAQRQEWFEIRFRKTNYTQQEIAAVVQFLAAYPSFITEEEDIGAWDMIAPTYTFWKNASDELTADDKDAVP